MSIIPASVPAPVLPRRRQLLFGTMFVSAAVAMFEFSLVASYLAERAGSAMSGSPRTPFR
jgi:hypothetical protein